MFAKFWDMNRVCRPSEESNKNMIAIMANFHNMQVYWPKNHNGKTFQKYLVLGMIVDFLLKKRLSTDANFQDKLKYENRNSLSIV